MNGATRYRWALLAIVLLVARGAWAAEKVDDDCKDEPPCEPASQAASSRPAGAALTFAGGTPADHLREIRRHLARKYPGVDGSSAGLEALAAYLAGKVYRAAGGRFEVSPREYGKGQEAFAAYRRFAPAIAALRAPEPFKEYLRRHYAAGLIDQRWAMDFAVEAGRLARIPADSHFVAIGVGEGLLGGVAKVFPRFRDLPGLAKKLVLDAVAELNPGVASAGWYRAAPAAPNLPADHVAVAMGGGRVHVHRYEVRPGACVAIPPAAVLSRLADPPLLDLRGSWISDLSLLKGFSPVELDVSYTAVTDLAGLADLASLEALSLAGLPIGDLSPLRGLKLKRLDISGTAVADLSPLAGMHLEELIASGAGVADVRALKGAPLRRLDLSRTAIADLSSLRGMPLERLNLDHTPVADLSDLAGMRLVWLNIDHTGAADLGPLAGMPLQHLICSPTRAFAGLAALRDVATLKSFRYAPADEWRQAYDRTHRRPAALPGPRAGKDVEDIKLDP